MANTVLDPQMILHEFYRLVCGCLDGETDRRWRGLANYSDWYRKTGAKHGDTLQVVKREPLPLWEDLASLDAVTITSFIQLIVFDCTVRATCNIDPSQLYLPLDHISERVLFPAALSFVRDLLLHWTSDRLLYSVDFSEVTDFQACMSCNRVSDPTLGLAIRMVRAYDPMVELYVTRFDMLFGMSPAVPLSPAHARAIQRLEQVRARLMLMQQQRKMVA
jgi:hypothetical protein